MRRMTQLLALHGVEAWRGDAWLCRRSPMALDHHRDRPRAVATRPHRWRVCLPRHPPHLAACDRPENFASNAVNVVLADRWYTLFRSCGWTRTSATRLRSSHRRHRLGRQQVAGL